MKRSERVPMIYDPQIDLMRPVTQADVDRLTSIVDIMARARRNSHVQHIEDMTHLAIVSKLSCQDFARLVVAAGGTN